MQRKGCALADIRNWAVIVMSSVPTHPHLRWEGPQIPCPWPQALFHQGREAEPSWASQRSRSHWPQPAQGLSSLLPPPPWGPEGMWTPLTLDYSSHTESQAPGLMRTRGENSNDLKTRQAGSLGPLRDTGPSGLTEKVRLRPLCALETGISEHLVSLLGWSQHWQCENSLYPQRGLCLWSGIMEQRKLIALNWN